MVVSIEEYSAVALESIQSTFDVTRDLNVLIVDQNQRFGIAAEVFAEEKEILELVESSIAEEQRATFTNIVETVRASGDLYPDIGRLSVLLETELLSTETYAKALKEEGEVKAQTLERLKEERETAQRDKYDQLIEQVEKLAPNALDRAKELLGNRLQSDVSSDEVRELEDDVLRILIEQDAQQERHLALIPRNEQIKELVATEGNAWPLPHALMKLYGTDKTQWVLDELPVEPKLSTTGHDRYIALRERHVDQPEASLYAAIYLTDKNAQTVTVDELAKFLYGDEIIQSLSDYNLRARVTTLLGPIAGECLHRILDSEGYVLQYGWRRILERNGGDQLKIKSRSRIYRAISLDDLGLITNEHPQDQEGVVDEFEVTPEIKQLIQLHTSGTDIEESDQDTTETREKIPAWVKKLRQDVGQELDVLEDLGLLADEVGVTFRVARNLSSSHAFATEETIDNVRTAGFLRRLNNINRSNWWSETVAPAEMILISLFNTNMDLLGKNQPNRRRAFRIISDAVDNYFEHKREEAKD